MKFISKFLIPWVSGYLLLAAATPAQSQTVHIAHCLETCPAGAASDQIVVRHLYAAAINRDSSLADWVAYRVLPDSVGVASLLPRYWQQEELLPAGVELETGARNGDISQPDLSAREDRSYLVNEFQFGTEDRGRLAPMTSFAGTPYWDELNRLSNMTPMPGDLRTGSWARLEQAINELAARRGELYVVSGPLYRIGSEGNPGQGTAPRQPDAYFKVVSDGDSHGAFLFTRDLPIHAHFCAQRSTIATVQSRSGIQLFPARQSTDDGLSRALGCNDP